MTQTNQKYAAVGAIVSVVAVSVAIAVSGDEQMRTTSVSVGLASPQTAVLDAWRDNGLEPGGFAPIEVEKLGDAECELGAVKGIEVVMCRYASIDEAAVAPEAAAPLIGDATGAALSAGKLLVVATDRHQSDPDGKHLNLLLNTFRSTAAGMPL